MTKTWSQRQAAVGKPTAKSRIAAGEILGFLKPRHDRRVVAYLPDGKRVQVLKTSNERNARRSTARTKRFSKESGIYSGADVLLTKNGAIIDP